MRNLSFLKTGYVYLTLIILITLAKIFYGDRGYPPSKCQSSSISGEEIEYPNLNDSMPHYQYRRIEDSVNNSRPKEIQHHQGNGWGSFGIHIGSFWEPEEKYYAGSNSYFITDPNYEFYEKNGKNYVRTVDWEKNKNGNCSGQQRERITPFKFIIEDKSKGNGYGMLLVPVKTNLGKILNFILVVSAFLLMAAGIYIFFVIFIQFLVAISKGKAFSERNVARLHRVGKYLLIVGFLPFIYQSIFYFMTRAELPSEVNFSFFRAFFEGSDSVIIGLFALLFASAFRQGLELQNEQELTV
jgi:hypothetical protein